MKVHSKEIQTQKRKKNVCSDIWEQNISLIEHHIFRALKKIISLPGSTHINADHNEIRILVSIFFFQFGAPVTRYW